MQLPDKKTWALKMLAIAQGYVGVSRANNHDQVAKFLDLFGLPFAEDGTPLAFCAAGASWAAAKALAVLTNTPFTADNAVSVFRKLLPQVNTLFHTSAGVVNLQDAAEKAGTWLDVDDIDHDIDILPGWLILFKWSPTEHHVGIVREDDGDTIQTVEFNTEVNGQSGIVAYKIRPLANCVWGFIKTY